jgi:hypothetical protein
MSTSKDGSGVELAVDQIWLGQGKQIKSAAGKAHREIVGMKDGKVVWVRRNSYRKKKHEETVEGFLYWIVQSGAIEVKTLSGQKTDKPTLLG